MRKAFTLIELLVVIAIIAIMVTAGSLSLAAGKGAARVKGATRDIFAAIRHARSTALVTGQPAIITYSTVEEDGEVMAKVELTTAKLFDSSFDRSKVQTLSGDPLKDDGYELVHIEKADGKPAETDGKDGTAAPAESGGETIEEILFAPIASDVVKGMRVKVVLGDEELSEENEKRPSKISVFSNVDYLIGRFKDAKAEAKKKEAEAAGEKADSDKDGKSSASAGEDQEPVSVVWETNGRVDPHQVWIYADGTKPEDGLLIRIDRFGAAKVMPGDGKEDD